MTTTRPTPPIEFSADISQITDRFQTTAKPLSESFLTDLNKICPSSSDLADRVEHSRDWWPLAMHWSLNAQTARRADAICRPTTTSHVSDIVTLCSTNSVPVTVSGGRSGVCGAAIPLFGGVVIDMTSLAGVISVDEISGLVEVLPGTFGPDLENALREKYDLSVGHFPQSFDISTVGGWIGSRGAGQFSTRYGKIDDMVAGLEVVLADGSVILTGTEPAGAAGPSLTSLFIGSEGSFGIISKVWLRAHPIAPAQRRAAYMFGSFADAVEAMRVAIRSGATPAVLRLYDERESKRAHGGDGTQCALLVLDEGENILIDAMMKVVDNACQANNAQPADVVLVDHWMNHRNDTSGLQALSKKGFVIDTMEVAVCWSKVNQVAETVKKSIMTVPGARSASCHISHSYIDGACIYFTFVAEPASNTLEAIEITYEAIWNAAQNSALDAGANLSHHHGVGINRAKFIKRALGPAHDVLAAIKHALDPQDILNPGKLGFASNRGEVKTKR
ncbi:MAG: FAD-binding oxidoreductase [Actinobacteria bacterium]|nr:FAD-binding oxidoreductase [Actinomycetota bacterium]